MIGVDTNVLLRLYVSDEPQQHETAIRFFAKRSEESPAYVSMVVLVEFVWALTKTYDYGWNRVLSLVGAMIDLRDMVIEREEIVADALTRALEEKVDFVDAIIARANADDGCMTTVTFDKRAAKRLASMELLT